MEIRKVERNAIAELKLVIVNQQERVAELARAGEKAQARVTRDRLIGLLNRLDVMRALARQSA
jgi:hypothetical protein